MMVLMWFWAKYRAAMTELGGTGTALASAACAFCLYGFLPPPDTSLRVFVEAVPWRRFTSCAMTTWWRTALLGVTPNTCSLSSSCSTASPAMLYTVVEGITVTSSMLPDHEQAADRARHRAFDYQQIALSISLNYLQFLCRHAFMAHVTSHTCAL